MGGFLAGVLAVPFAYNPVTTASSWIGWNDETVLPVIEGDIEWWPFIFDTGESQDTLDWMITDAITLNINGWIYGDANHDGKIDVGDLGIIGTNWKRTGVGWEQGDFNRDGVVDVGDLGMMGAHYGTTYSPVPEPSTLAILAFGMMGLRTVFSRKRR